MTPVLSPEEICKKVCNHQLTKAVATELLISLLEGSDDDELRSKCIESFSKLALKKQKIFRIIENCLVSDKSSLVRKSAAKIIIQDFPKKDNYLVLKWAVKHESSVIVIKQLLDLFNSLDDPHFDFFKKDLLRRLEKVYGIVQNEIELLLNLAVLCTEFTKDYDLKVKISWFKIMELLKKFPDTLGLIPRLNYLKSGGDQLNSLPKTVISLSNLRMVYFRGNEISSLPNFWDRVRTIKR